MCYYAGDSADHHTDESTTKTQLNLALQWCRGKSDAGDISQLILCMVKLSLCLGTYTRCHEDDREEELQPFLTQHSLEVSGRLHALDALSLVSKPPEPTG